MVTRDAFDLADYRSRASPCCAASWTQEDCEQARTESDRLMRLCDADRETYGPDLELEVDHVAPEYRRHMDRVIRKIEPISDISDFFARMALREAITRPARAVFDDDVRLFEDKLNLKLPGGSPYPWHQDWPCCWRAETDELVTCFVYLDDADVTNGCLHVIPGSHLGRPTTRSRATGTSRSTPRPWTSRSPSRSRSRPAT